MSESLLFFDIECFKYDSLLVIKDINKNIRGVWWSSPPGDFPEDSPNGFEGVRGFIQGKTLVGYNNHHYDDLVLIAMMDGEPQSRIKAVNDAIIGNREEDVIAYKRRAVSIDTLDTMQQIDVSMPSLKQIEGNMGRSIVESEIDFDIDRPLTEREKQQTLQYCSYDVDNTIEIYKLREKSYFQVKDTLLTMLPERSKLKNPRKLNTTTLSADILLEKPLPKWAEMRLPDAVRNTPNVPEKVWEMWHSQERTNSLEAKDEKITVREFGCDITFASGGLHGVAVQGKEFSKVKLLDVGSMYPSIVVNLEALGPGTIAYNNMRMERLLLKKTDPLRANAYKLILNSVYGNLKNKYSILCNPLASLSVCAYGQLALFDLSRRLYDAGYTLVNLNTDGVAFVDYKGLGSAWEDVQGAWEETYTLKLDLDEFDRWIQKDVNNYVAVGVDGHIKVKGGDCNKYHEDKFFSNNNARIIHKALVDNLLFDIPVSKTVREHLDDPALYQYILKAGRTYLGVVDGDGNEYQNVNRIFATKSDTGVRLFKKRADGGLVNFPDMPDNMLVWNGEVSDLAPTFKEVVNVSHYCKVTEKKLEGWR